MLAMGFLLGLIRFLFIIVVLAAVGIWVYRLLCKSAKIQQMVDPEGPTVLEQAKDVEGKANTEKAAMTAEVKKINREKKELEEIFPGDKKRKKK